MGLWAYMTGAPGASGYGSATTAEEVATAYDAQLRGKVAIVTGAAGGIGLETARVFANHGATVYVSARSASKCDEAIAAIRAAAPSGGAELKLKPFVADLGSFKTIKAAVDAFLADNVPLHILVCNAGVMACPKALTADGFEMQFGTNHVGHQYLTSLLLEKLKASAPARVVVLSSNAQANCYRNGIQFDDLSGDKSYLPWLRYAHSKFANMLYARGMQAENVPGVTFYSVHPGIIATSLWRHSFVRFLVLPGAKSVAQGTATTVFCAVSDKAVPGEYHEDCNATPSTHPHATDLAMAKRLIDVTDALIQAKTAAPAQ